MDIADLDNVERRFLAFALSLSPSLARVISSIIDGTSNGSLKIKPRCVNVRFIIINAVEFVSYLRITGASRLSIERGARTAAIDTRVSFEKVQFPFGMNLEVGNWRVTRFTDSLEYLA